MDLLGIHHRTAISADIRENHRFYRQGLGMRLVKRSVNQDDVSAYHLFYADAKGSPGTDLTFFDWSIPKERFGTRSIVRTHLRVRGAATLEWWREHFEELDLTHGGIAEVDGRLTLPFEDREGQRLTLIDDAGQGDPPALYDRSPVPEEHQIRGLGPIVISVPTLTPTSELLIRVLGMRQVRDYPHPDNAATRVHVFESGERGMNLSRA
jgi:glyoxalase family protein